MKSFGQHFSALVIGASGGLGRAIADDLEQRASCVRVARLSRSDEFDLRNEASIQAAAARLADETFELIFDATGVLTINDTGPEKSLADLDPAIMAQSFQINAIGPALVLKHFFDRLPRSARGVFATLSARVGSIGDNRLGGWYSYRASKAALNQLMHGAAIEVARKRPESVILCLHPGTVPTPLSAPYARDHTHTPKVAAERLLQVIDTANVEQSGGFFAYDGSEIPW
jgi:NAD(P)-dependent dehydrogenase (short-subunit alcohol dehydrogenase family)